MGFNLATAQPIVEEKEGLALKTFDLSTASRMPVDSTKNTAFDDFKEGVGVFVEQAKEAVAPFIKGARKIGEKALPAIESFEESPAGKFLSTEFATDEEVEKHPIAGTFGMISGSITPFVLTAPVFPQSLLGTMGTFATVEGVSEVGVQEMLGEDKPLDIALAVTRGAVLGPIWHYSSGLRFIGKPVASALARAGTRGAGVATVSAVFGEDLGESFKQGGVVMALSLMFESPMLAKTALGRQIVKQARSKAKAAGFPAPEIPDAAIDAAASKKSLFELIKTLGKVIKTPIVKAEGASKAQIEVSARTGSTDRALMKMSESVKTIGKVPKAVDPLIEEAKKFKTAEEFVESQEAQFKGIEDEKAIEAINNTQGAKITDKGLELDLSRYQKEQQAGIESSRTGVFYLPEKKSPYGKYYSTGKYGYGGSEKIESRTVFRNPIIVKAGTGGIGIKKAYDLIEGKGAYEKMRSEVLSKAWGGGINRRADENAIAGLLEKYGGNPDLVYEIVRVSKEGNTLAYAIQEHIAAHAVRKAGYDAVISHSVSAKQPRLSEVFDVRQLEFPEESSDFLDLSEHYALPYEKVKQLTDIYNKANKVAPPVEPPADKPVSKAEGEDNLIAPDKSLNDAFTDVKESFFAERDIRIFESKVEKRSLQKQILEASGEKKYNANVKDIDKAIHIAIDSKRNPAHVTDLYDKLTDEQKRIVDLSQNLPPKAQKIVDQIEESYRKTGLEALDAGIIRNVLDSYANRIWDLENKSTTELGKKFGASTRHAKQRKFGTIIEGMSEGYNLKVESATNNLQILKEEISKAIASKNLITQMKKTKNLDGQPLITTKFIEGYQKIDVPNFNEWKYAGEVEKGKSYGKNFFINNDMIFERQDLYAPKDVAKRINKIFGRSGLSEVPGIKTLTKYNAIAKAWILQSSLFHHLAFMRSYYLGTNNKRFEDMDILQAYQAGIKSIENSDPNVRLGVANGLTLGLRQDWEENLLHEKTAIGDLVDKIPGGTAVKEKILGLRQAQADFLFGEFGAGLKAKAFLIELRNHQKAHPDLTADQAAKEVANLINDDFGGLHLERMERNPTLQHIFRLLMLAPDWTESNIRTMVKAVNSGKASETNMYRKFWAGILVKGALLTTLANMLMASIDEDDEETKGVIERFFRNYRRSWEEGNLKATKVDVTPIYKFFKGKTDRRKYFSILGHFTDPMKFILHPIKSAKHKGSVLFNFFYDAVTGTDWAGRRFTTLAEFIGQDKDKGLYKTTRKGKYKKGDPKYGKLTGQTVTFDYKRHPLTYEQMPSYLVNKLKGVQPVQVQNLISWQMGEMEGFDALANSMGLGISSTYGDD